MHVVEYRTELQGQDQALSGGHWRRGRHWGLPSLIDPVIIEVGFFWGQNGHGAVIRVRSIPTSRGRAPLHGACFKEVVRSKSAAGKASTTRSTAVQRPPPPRFGVKTDRSEVRNSSPGWMFEPHEVHLYLIFLITAWNYVLCDVPWSSSMPFLNICSGWNGWKSSPHSMLYSVNWWILKE